MEPLSAQFTSAARAARIGQLLDDFVARRGRGEAADEAALLAAHPDLADELRPHLALLRALRVARAPEAELAAAGFLPTAADRAGAGRLGPYRVDGVLGRGGMGLVLKAYDEQLGRPVALKVLRAELVGDSAALARFEREARTAAALQHPNIATVFAVGRERGLPYLAMEYVDGPTLADLISARRVPSPATGAPDIAAAPSSLRTAVASSLPAHAVRRVLRELLLGLTAAHQAGLVHRDIKSANILLKREGLPGLGIGGVGRTHETPGEPGAESRPGPAATPLDPAFPSTLGPVVKLVDFGLARMRSAHTRVTLDGSVLGTPEYMSPEQARGDADVDHRTDLYSTGVVLYEMLTGHTPFRADTPTATLHRILSEEPRDPRHAGPGVDPVLAGIALRLMAKRPEDRFASAGDVLRALDNGVRIPHPEGRRRLRGLCRGAAGIALVAFAIGLLARHANRPQGPEASAPIDAPARIARVWFEAHHQEGDGPAERMIWINRQGDPSPRVLHEFPREVGWINAAQLVDLDGRGRQLVVVGLGQPLRSESVTRGYERRPTTPANVIALDAEGRPVWGLDLQDELSRPWPDCQAPALWTCNALAAGDLDGRPGDELVAVGHHMREYPSRISIIDPRTATIDHTYWHMGQLSAAEVEADFLGPGRPAIVSWGVNNKLDGFNDEPPRRDEGGRAHYDCVSVLMVLDPQAMDGLGPPHTDRMPGLPSATPYAYAYLDLAASPDTARIEHGESRRFRSARCEIGTIKSVTPSPYADAWKALSIGRLALDDIARANLYVDRNLNLVRFQVGVAGAECETPVDWPAVWRPLVQGGRPASLRPPGPATQPSP